MLKSPVGLTGLWRNNSNLITRRRVWAARYGMGPSATIGTGPITLVNPVSYRVFQRAGSIGPISISGTYTGTPGAIEGSFNGGAWTTFQELPTGGVFSGILADQTGGQGILSVRWRGNEGSVVTRTLVGVADDFIIAGQSNACGMTAGNQSYSHASLSAVSFANDYAWKNMTDPTDSNSGQVDSVSSDTGVGGSCWPTLATLYMASQGTPMAIVPCALQGSNISSWQPGANHQDRTTLYGSMVYRALQTGCKVVLWWQGEENCIQGTSEAQYNSWLDTLADSIYEDLGVKLMPCKLEQLIHSPWDYSTANVNNAIATAWSDNPHVLTGPDFSDQDWGGAHYASADTSLIAGRWWTAIRTAFGWAA